MLDDQTTSPCINLDQISTADLKVLIAVASTHHDVEDRADALLSLRGRHITLKCRTSQLVALPVESHLVVAKVEQVVSISRRR